MAWIPTWSSSWPVARSRTVSCSRRTWGADAGVEYLFDRSVVVIDGGIGVRDAEVGSLLDSLLQHVAWTIWRMRAVATIAVQGT
jgi:hypothetical protein